MAITGAGAGASATSKEISPPAKAIEATAAAAADTKQRPSLSWREKLNKVISNVTVEPVLAAYIMPSVLSGLATQNLNLDKACRVNMNYGDEVCDALILRNTQNYTLEEETVQQMVARMTAWKTVVQSLFPCLLILFWGSWSDRHHRRKPCIMIPIVGEFIGTVGLMLCVYFHRTPMEVAALTEAIFPSLSGGWFTVLMGVFSYIADITTEEDRTLRIGILNVCFSMGVPIGMAFSGVLLKKIGFYGVFSISACFYLIAFFYALLFLKEPRARPEKEGKDKPFLSDFFDKSHVVDTFKVAFKRGENQRRQRVILLMIVVMVVIGPMHGEMAVTYLFTRFRFNWSEVEFSFFSTFAMVTGLIGVAFCVGVISHKLKIDDAIVGVISSTSKILSGFVYAFAFLPWHMYVGAIVEIFNGTAFIAMRSIATKLVRKDELGKVNSLFGVAEALMPVVFGPMYTTLYSATLKVLPGAFFLLGGALTIPAVVIFMWMYNFQRKQKLKDLTPASAAAASAAGDKEIGCVLEATKESHCNLNPMDAVVMVVESKAPLNGLVTGVMHEPLEPLEATKICDNASSEAGVDNKAYERDPADVGPVNGKA